MFIVTNNENIVKNITNIEVGFYDKTYLEILEMARDYIHINHRLLTHPLYGSIKPNETLYRTIILEKTESLDNSSLHLIEEAIDTTNKFLENAKPSNWPESVKDDFRVIDLDIIENAIKSIY